MTQIIVDIITDVVILSTMNTLHMFSKPFSSFICPGHLLSDKSLFSLLFSGDGIAFFILQQRSSPVPEAVHFPIQSQLDHSHLPYNYQICGG